jgi:hypothetical protein
MRVDTPCFQKNPHLNYRRYSLPFWGKVRKGVELNKG